MEAVPAPPSPSLLTSRCSLLPATTADSTGSSQGQHCCSYSPPGNWGKCPSWTHLGQFSRLLHPVSSYPARCLVPSQLCDYIPSHSSLGIQGNPAFAIPSLSHTTVFPLALEVSGQQGFCLECLQPLEPVNHGAGIISKAGEAQSRHCLKPTRDSVPPY